ncbi:MAG: glycosyltransferase family 39 protein [Pyrinomonadaceae bacterium]
MHTRRPRWLVYAVLLIASLSLRMLVARLLPNDEPFDGKVYSQIASNLLEQHVYSHATEPPYSPSLIRLPGYPIFLATIYSVFGRHDDAAVRIVQVLIDTAACALIALIAFYWEPDEKLKPCSSIAAFALAALCPFTTIYVATILTETPTVFLAVAMCLSATLAFKATKHGTILSLWTATGLIAGFAVLFRPDNGLFAAAVGITLVATALAHSGDEEVGKSEEILFRISRASFRGLVFSLAFCLVLVPWTVRNFRVFHLFQPLAPAHAEMPGEFVPRGYLAWLRTWIDDERDVGPVLWALDESPIYPEEIPDRAFDSAEEKQRVTALLEEYNHPPDEESKIMFASGSRDADVPPEDQRKWNDESESGETEREPVRDNEREQSEETDQSDEAPAPDQTSQDQYVEMTSVVDAGFAKIAGERIAHHPLRYFVLLPIKRAVSLWFDTHSQYYPFQGELLPLADLDYDIHQEIWLPLFAGFTWLYTLLGVAGAWVLWRSRDFTARRWVVLAGLIIFLRLGFFATLENPEPRYVVEIFPFLAILGGASVGRIFKTLQTSRA